MKTKNIIVLLAGFVFLCASVGYIHRKAIMRFIHHSKLECNAQKTIDIDDLKSIDLPLVIVQTENHIEPSFEEVISPTGWGQGIKNADYVKMNIDILFHDSILYSNRNSDGETVNTSKIRVRGNTSAYGDMKSFKIKFANKVDLIREGERCEDKEWVLLPSHGNLNTAIGLETNRLLGMDYTPRFQYVILVVNNNYRGLYVLTESLRKNKAKVDISKEGYIIEADAYFWNEDFYFKTNLLNEHLGYTFKYPSSKKRDTVCVNYIKEYILEFESSIASGEYDKYIDIDSWTSWLLVHDILGNRDCAGSNIYLSKTDRSDSTKLKMPTTWDFDNIYVTKEKWAAVHDSCFYYHLLFNSVNPIFKKNYCSTYKSISSDFFQKMDRYLSSIESGSIGKSLDECRKLDAKRWDYPYKPLHDELTEIRRWFLQRKRWMDSQVSSME